MRLEHDDFDPLLVTEKMLQIESLRGKGWIEVCASFLPLPSVSRARPDWGCELTLYE